MSTKMTIAHGKEFHLYDDCCDERNIYLRLDGLYFEASNHGVVIEIPIALWEHIRQFKSSNFDVSMVDWTDEQILKEAEKTEERNKSSAFSFFKMNKSLADIVQDLTAERTRQTQLKNELLQKTNCK